MRVFLTGGPAVAGFALLSSTLAVLAAPPREPADFLAEVEAVGEPPFDPQRKQEPGYLEHYKTQQHILYRRKAAILLELCKTHPHDARVPDWMNRRWVLLGWNQEPADVADEVLADISSVLAENENERVARHGAFWRAYFEAHRAAGNAPAMYEHVETFTRAFPEDERGAELLYLVATDESAKHDLQLSIFSRLHDDYADTHFGRYALGMIRRIEALHQRFELAFRDVRTKEPVSISGLRGEVVVIDFWATTCPPCVAEMPHLKELYAKYHPRGVEFIGVSLDESEKDGGRDALKSFLSKHDIPWRQFYQGAGYDSDFSKSWGVGSAPTVFLIDKAGRLRYTDAQGKVEELISILLAE